MSTNIDNLFTADEWQVLENTPMNVGQAMRLASKSNLIGEAMESSAFESSIKELKNTGSPSPLMRALSERLSTRRGEILPGEVTSAGPPNNPAAARMLAIESCQQVTTILEKASPEDAAAYKQYVLSFATRVAGAGGEEGFLGLGKGKKISDAEQVLLNDLAKALGTTP
jgi:hypothetical protein